MTASVGIDNHIPWPGLLLFVAQQARFPDAISTLRLLAAEVNDPRFDVQLIYITNHVDAIEKVERCRLSSNAFTRPPEPFIRIADEANHEVNLHATLTLFS